MDSSTSGSMDSSYHDDFGCGGGDEEEPTSQPVMFSSLSPNFDNFSNVFGSFTPNLHQDMTATPTTTHSSSAGTSQVIAPICNTILHPSSSMSLPTGSPARSGGLPHRISKRRARVSRRPPTTVLTTDTSNFREMVQKFTGFPALSFAPLLSAHLEEVAGFLPSNILRPIPPDSQGSLLNSNHGASTSTTSPILDASNNTNTLFADNMFPADPASNYTGFPHQHPNHDDLRHQGGSKSANFGSSADQSPI